MTVPDDAPYKDAALPIDDRVDDLVARMTLDEKLAQISCVWSTHLVEGEAFSPRRAREAMPHGTGQVTRIAASTGLRPAENAAFMNDIQRWLLEETRLGIPALVHEESTAGFCGRDATQFPQAIGLAATFDPDGIEALGRTVRDQMTAVGARHTLAPVLDVTRDPRWGRTEETYGECPYLASRMGVAYVRGVQGDDLSSGVAATAKHFVGYGMSEGGLNHGAARIGPRELREVYARPFESAIREANLASVMNAYNDVDGLPCGGSKQILDDLLRGELGFTGVVVADYFTTSLLIDWHHVAADAGEAGQRALEAGIDVELPARACYGEPMKARIESGELDERFVNRALRRHLRLKLELGLFESPYVDPGAAAERYGRIEDAALARRLAAESTVLLTNDGTLPLERDVGAIALIGPCANDVRLLQGDYSYPAHTEIVHRAGERADEGDILPATDVLAFAPGPYYPESVTLLEGLGEACGPGTELHVARGCELLGDDRSGFAEAVAAARASQVAVVCVGGRSGLMSEDTSGEFRDASSLGLTGVQEELVHAVIASGTPTVVVLMGGRIFALPEVAAKAAAMVAAFCPGEQGGNGVADLLLGRAGGGRLPISMARSVGQVPVYYNHRSGSGRSQMRGDYIDGPTRPLFPFGHGLSYGRFEYGPLSLGSEEWRLTEPLQVGFELTNVGERDADEVVQLYLRDEVARVARPVKQLAGFARLHVPAGETRRLTFEVDASQLGYYDEEMCFVVEPGDVEILVGASSEDIRQRVRTRIGGRIEEIATARILPTRVSVR